MLLMHDNFVTRESLCEEALEILQEIVDADSALQVSLRLAGVKADDQIIVPTVTFIAPVNAVHYK